MVLRWRAVKKLLTHSLIHSRRSRFISGVYQWLKCNLEVGERYISAWVPVRGSMPFPSIVKIGGGERFEP